MKNKCDMDIYPCDTKVAYEIFDAVFGDISEEQFVNKHDGNPEKLEHPLWGGFENNNLVGINGFMGCSVDLNGRNFKAAQSCDTAVLKEYRGKGVFTQIVLNAEKILVSEGVKLLFGAPNEKSLQGFIKMGWKLGADTAPVYFRSDFFVCRNKCGGIYQVIDSMINNLQLFKLKCKTSNLLQVEFSTKCSFQQTEILMQTDLPNVHIHKELSYYRWRIDDNNKENGYVIIRKKEKFLGYAVYRYNKTNKPMVEVVDWNIYSDANHVRVQVLSKIILEIKNRTKGYIHIPFVNMHSSDFVLLKTCGFVLDKKARQKILYKALDENLEKIIRDKEWNIRYIDIDTIKNV